MLNKLDKAQTLLNTISDLKENGFNKLADDATKELKKLVGSVADSKDLVHTRQSQQILDKFGVDYEEDTKEFLVEEA